MKYHWPQRKHNGASEDGKNAVQPCTIELMTAQEFQHTHPAVFRRSFSGYVYQSSRFCKAERLHKATAGTYAMPRQQDLTGEKLTFGYCILEDRLIFLDDRSCVKDLLHQMEGYEMTDISDPRMVFFDFLEFLVKDDIVFLQSYEDSLNELEEDLLARKQDNFERRILQVRKELAVLGAYYEQLSDMGETLQQEAAERDGIMRSFCSGCTITRSGDCLIWYRCSKSIPISCGSFIRPESIPGRMRSCSF